MRIRRFALLLLGCTWIGVATISGAACGGGEAPTSSPPPLATATSTPQPEDADAPRDAPVLEASETAKTFVGSLAATSTVPFGGTPYCKYEVTLKEVKIEITILETGYVGTATVRNLVLERAVDCPYVPMDPTIQDFGLKQSVTTTTGTRIDFTASKNNQPATSLVVELTATATGYDATMTWHRTDQQPPLDWTVTAKVPLVRR